MSFPDALVKHPDEPVSPVLTPDEARVLTLLRKAHVMGCSDPLDTSRHTTPGDASLVIEALAARLEAATPTATPTDSSTGTTKDTP